MTLHRHLLAALSGGLGANGYITRYFPSKVLAGDTTPGFALRLSAREGLADGEVERLRVPGQTHGRGFAASVPRRFCERGRAMDETLEPSGRSQAGGDDHSARGVLLPRAARFDDVACRGMGALTDEKVIHREDLLSVVQTSLRHGDGFRVL